MHYEQYVSRVILPCMLKIESKKSFADHVNYRHP